MYDEDQWYGVFQQYRPHGDRVEELFEGISDATEYVERLRSVCQAAYHEGWQQDGYFVVRSPAPTTPAALMAFGTELVASLWFVADFAVPVGKGELQSYLSTVTGPLVVQPCELNRKHDDNLFVQETVGDLLQAFYDYSHRIIQLREGYYSIACDYWLAWYLQWPFFRRWIPRDVFRPYFDLWAGKCECAFQGKSLCLAINV